MKTTELRIGNCVQWDNDKGEIETINSINNSCVGLETDMVTDVLTPIEFLKPIPLTEEWLLKFGFEKDKKYTKWHLVNPFFMITRRTGIYSYFGRGGVPLQYVHQLQKLYFALTGEELTINTEIK